MEEEVVPKKQFRLKKKWMFISISLFLLFSMFVVAYLFLYQGKGGPVSDVDPYGEGESSTGTVELIFADGDEKDSDPLKLNKVKIRSMGEVYEKEVIVEGRPVNLFILKSLYKDAGSSERELDVVVGILFDGSYENILNWWTYNLVIKEIDIDSLGNDFFDVDYLESIFRPETKWEYLYYSGPSVPVSEEYLKVAKEVLKGEDLDTLEERLSSGESQGLILMPYLIYDSSD